MSTGHRPGPGRPDPGLDAIADGRGLASAALRPIEGAEQIARYLADIAGQMPGNVTILERTGSTQPRQTPALDDGLTRVPLPIGSAASGQEAPRR